MTTKKTKLKQEKYGNYQFCNTEDLMNCWINYHYPNSVVVVLYQAFHAFDLIPELNILKRDKYKVFIKGIESEYAFIQYDDVVKASDFVYSFEYKHKIKWAIYDKAILHSKSK